MARFADSMLCRCVAMSEAYNETGELPGEKIQSDERNDDEQKDRNHSNKNIGNDQPVSQTP